MDVMKKKPFVFFVALFFFLAFISCQNKPSIPFVSTVKNTAIDTLSLLQRVRGRGVLKAVTNCEIINYNTENPSPSGFEYELLSDFCSNNGLKLEMIVNENLESCFRLLDSCQVDVVAVCVGSNKDMKRRYLLTNPILMQRSVLVQRLPKDWYKMPTANEVENQLLRSSIDLAGKTIHLPQGSHEVKLLEHLSDQIGDTIYVVECDSLNSVDLVKAVAAGQIDYTVVEEYVARMASIGFKDLDTKLTVSVEHPLGWALQRNDGDSSLLIAINSWIDNFEQRNLNRILANYINKGNVFSTHKPANGVPAELDGIIKQTARNIGWDWRLLASLIYQESRFKFDLESEKGAFGLMQLMPVVMEQYGIDYDAQRLAMKYGKYPDVWDNNVDYFILNKSKRQYYNDTCCRAGSLRGIETYRFVEEVLDRYYQYQAFYN